MNFPALKLQFEAVVDDKGTHLSSPNIELRASMGKPIATEKLFDLVKTCLPLSLRHYNFKKSEISFELEDGITSLDKGGKFTCVICSPF